MIGTSARPQVSRSLCHADGSLDQPSHDALRAAVKLWTYTLSQWHYLRYPHCPSTWYFGRPDRSSDSSVSFIRPADQTKLILAHFDDNAFVRSQQQRALDRYILAIEMGRQHQSPFFKPVDAARLTSEIERNLEFVARGKSLKR